MEVQSTRLRRWTRAEYARLIEAGIFRAGEPVELLAGAARAHRRLGAGARRRADARRPAGLPRRASLAPRTRHRGRGVDLALDREHKGSLYARAGIADYWILNLVDRVLEVYREPREDPAARFGWRYAWSEVLSSVSSTAPLVAPGARVVVAELLP